MSDPGPNLPPLETFQETIGHRFIDPELLRRALTHSSHARDTASTSEHNQRLEFLGDAVLSMIVAEKLYHEMPGKREGVLTRNRAILTKGIQLTALAKELDLAPHILLAEAEEKNSGRERPGLLEDTLEAVVGAIYLDAGWEKTKQVVLQWYGDLALRLEGVLEDHNPKGTLQELVQADLGNGAVAYEVTAVEGPPHQRTFQVAVRINEKILGQGSGNSKKSAEEAAARTALQSWKPTEKAEFA
jgi:ribonuclease III